VVDLQLQKGFVDLEQPMANVLASMCDEIAGPGAYGRYLDDLGQNISTVDEEITTGRSPAARQ